jgi:hypothetical protein
VTLIITSPTTGEPFGPGFQLTASSTFVGPLEPDSFWLITLTAPANEDIMLTMTVPTVTNALSTLVVQGSLQLPGVVEGRPLWVTGEGAQIQIDLVEPIGGIADSGTVQVILDRQTGQNAELQTWIQQQLLAQPVGLTTEQGEQLTRVESSIAISAGINPLELVGDVVQAIATHNPLGYGSLSVVYTITGDGELPNEDPILPKWGVYWLATVIPVGLGHRHGQSEEYPSRLIQWRTVHEVGGTEMVTAINDSETHGELWRFPTQTPRRLEYSILPNVVVQAQWWQFP